MVVMKIKLYKDSAGALHAEFLDGLNSVSQNNSNVNGVLVVLDNFDLMPEEVLRIAYELESGAEVDDYTLMEDNGDGTYSAEVPPAVTRSDVGTEWFLGLQIASNWVENDDYTGYLYKQNLVERLKFKVNNAVRDLNGKYPSRGDLTALYQEAQKKIEKEALNDEKKVSKSGDVMTGDLTFLSEEYDPRTAKIGFDGAEFANELEETSATITHNAVLIQKENKTTAYKENGVRKDDRTIFFPEPRYRTPTEENPSADPYDETIATEHYVDKSVEPIKSDINGLRQDIINESHFRGYLLNDADVQALAGNANDYAYSAESGTKWIYNATVGHWIDSGVPVPNQGVPASDSSPLMDGEPSAGQKGAYSRADHRHPSDTSKVNKAGDTMTGDLRFEHTVPWRSKISDRKLSFDYGYGMNAVSLDAEKLEFKNYNLETPTRYDAEGIDNQGRKIKFPEVRYHIPEMDDTAYYALDETLATLSDVEPIAYKLDTVEEIAKEIEVINLALGQSGLVKKYKQPITQEYTERVTADGANVLDGSKAVLKKLVGSTIACKNYFNAEVATVGAETTASAFISSVSQGSVTVKTISGYVGLGLAYTEKTLADFCPNIKVGQTVYFNANVNGEPFQKAVYLSQTNVYWVFGTQQTITQEMLNAHLAFIGLRSNIDASNVGEVTYSNIRITESANEEYQPYFTGLKSASFGGIESTNADGTETSTLAFPKTETPLGVTIDFENKKIVDYAVTIEFKGTAEDGISYYQYGANENRRNGIRLHLAKAENFAKGVSTDGVIAENASQLGATAQIAIGYNNSIDLFWVGFIDDIGITAKGEAPADTNAVMQQVQAYLAQRYADGNPVTIRYVSSVLQNETNFTADNEYTVWKNGTEKVLDNDGAEFGADNTLTQDYILVTEVK